MKIWKLQPDVNNYDDLIPIEDEDRDKINFLGGRLVNHWTPVPVKFLEEIKSGDCPGLNPSAPVFSEKAVEILKDLMEDSVEILPLHCRKGNYYAINVIDVLNCIDYSNSKFITFPNSNRIMVFEKYAFIVECVSNKNIFKIIDEPSGVAFVSDAFRGYII